MKFHHTCYLISLILIVGIIIINQPYDDAKLSNTNKERNLVSLPIHKEVNMETLIRNVAGEEGVNPDIAKRIAFAESSFNPQAKNSNSNGSTDKGLFQINSIHGVPDSCRLNALCNTRWAIRKMAREGFGAWGASEHNWE